LACSASGPPLAWKKQGRSAIHALAGERRKQLHAGVQVRLATGALVGAVCNAAGKDAGCRALWKRKLARDLCGALAAFFIHRRRQSGFETGNRPVLATAVDKSSTLQVNGARNIEHQVAARLGYTRQDPAFGLFFSRQAGPFDLIGDLACEQFAHAGPAGAISARVRQPDTRVQAGLQERQTRSLFKSQTRGLNFYQE